MLVLVFLTTFRATFDAVRSPTRFARSLRSPYGRATKPRASACPLGFSSASRRGSLGGKPSCGGTSCGSQGVVAHVLAVSLLFLNSQPLRTLFPSCCRGIVLRTINDRLRSFLMVGIGKPIPILSKRSPYTPHALLGCY